MKNAVAVVRHSGGTDIVEPASAQSGVILEWFDDARALISEATRIVEKERKGITSNRSIEVVYGVLPFTP